MYKQNTIKIEHILSQFNTQKCTPRTHIYMLQKFEERCVKNNFYHEEGNDKFHIFIWVWGLVFFVSTAVLQNVLCVYVQRQVEGSKVVVAISCHLIK